MSLQAWELCAVLFGHLSELRMLAGLCSLPSGFYQPCPMAQSSSHSLLANLFRAPFPISLLPRSTVAQCQISVLAISTSAQTSRMNLFISVVLYPGLSLLAPKGSQQYCLTFRFEIERPGYSNKKANTKSLHFLMSIILPNSKKVWVHQSAEPPVGIKHGIICSGT